VSPIFERRIVPRGYEMNATGSVPLAPLARYAEHVRWDGLRDDEYGLNRYWHRGVVRAQRLQKFRDVQYGCELRITMWVARLGRTSLDFAHRIEEAHSAELVALASVTVVSLGSDGRPAPIPEQAAGYVRDEPLPSADPPAGEPPEQPFVRRIQVAPSDQDVYRHVNHARYIDFVEDTRAFAERAGAYGNAMSPELRNASSLSIAYDSEAAFPSELDVLTWAGADGSYDFRIRRRTDSVVLTRARVSL
jgi:acyl-CoA thioesterase FadM